MRRADTLILRAFAVWTIFVWGFFVRNLLSGRARPAGFVAVHLALAAVSIGFAVVTWAIASRSARPAPERDREAAGRR